MLSEQTEALYAELNKRAEAATSSYSATGDFLQHIYSVLVAKNHQQIQSMCLVHEFSFIGFFNDGNHGYRAAILKKNSSQPAFTCSKLTIETLEQGVKYVQS